jgi:hypothetical protein
MMSPGYRESMPVLASARDAQQRCGRKKLGKKHDMSVLIKHPNSFLHPYFSEAMRPRAKLSESLTQQCLAKEKIRKSSRYLFLS